MFKRHKGEIGKEKKKKKCEMYIKCKGVNSVKGIQHLIEITRIIQMF